MINPRNGYYILSKFSICMCNAIFKQRQTYMRSIDNNATAVH